MITWIQLAVRRGMWAPALVFGVHVLLSRGFDAYRRWPELDVPLHLLGGVAIASFYLVALRLPLAREQVGELTDAGRTLLVLGAVSASALIWEFAEWSTDRLGWTRAQGGLDDTLGDLLLGLAGGATMLLVDRRRQRRLTTAPRPAR